METARDVIASFRGDPDAWTVTPAQCLMKNGSMRIWLRDGLAGYQSGQNITCDDGIEWTDDERAEFAALWANRKRSQNIPQFPYPHRTMEEIFAEEDAFANRPSMVKRRPLSEAIASASRIMFGAKP